MQKSIAFFPATFDIYQNEAVNITTRIMSSHLAKAGHKTAICCRRKKQDKSGKSQANHEVVDGVDVFRPYSFSLRGSASAFSDTILSLFAAKKVKEYDVFHTMSAAPLLGIKARLLKLFYRKTVIHQLRTTSKFSLGSFRFARALNTLDLVLVPSKDMKNALQNSGCSSRIEVIHTVIDTKKFIPQQVSNDTKKKYGLPTDKQIILTYGHAKHEKGIDLFIQTAIQDQRYHFVYAYSGSGDATEYLEKARYVDNVTIITKRVNLPELICCADTVALLHRHTQSTEFPPSSIMESLSCNVPVVISDLPELRTLFSTCATLVDVRNVDNIIGAIGVSLDTDRKALKKAAAPVVASYSPQGVVQRYTELLHSLP